MSFHCSDVRVALLTTDPMALRIATGHHYWFHWLSQSELAIVLRIKVSVQAKALTTQALKCLALKAKYTNSCDECLACFLYFRKKKPLKFISIEITTQATGHATAFTHAFAITSLIL